LWLDLNLDATAPKDSGQDPRAFVLNAVEARKGRQPRDRGKPAGSCSKTKRWKGEE